MAGPTIRSVFSTTVAFATSARTLTINKPTGTAQNDLLVAYVCWRGEASPYGQTPAAPAGWTPRYSDFGGDYFYQLVYTKVATASEPSSYSFTITNTVSANIGGVGGIYALTGAEIVTNPLGNGTAKSGDSTNTVLFNSATTDLDNCLVIPFACFGSLGTTTIYNATPPSGYSEDWDAGANTGATNRSHTVETSHKTQAASGATGALSALTDDPFSTTSYRSLVTYIRPLLPSTTLQGVGNLTSDGSVIKGGLATLQGVGSLSAAGSQAWGGRTTLQGIAGFTGEAELTFIADFSKYDAYVQDAAGVFGLIYYESDQQKKQTNSKPLRPTRQDVGNNPFEIRPESGDTFSQGDFTHGSGQRYFHHSGGDPKKFLRSEGFDISEPGKLTHLHATAQAIADTSVGVLEQANGLPFVASGTTIKRGDGAWPGSWSNDDPFNGEGAVTVNDLCSSGVELYAALGIRGIHKRVSAGTWAHYSDVLATRISWIKGRIMAADGRSIYEVVSGPGAPAAIETLPDGWVFDDIFEAGSFIYACAINTGDVKSEIHIYGLNSGATAIEKKGSQEFPRGQLVRSGAGYLNTVFLGGGVKNSSAGGYDPVCYRAVPDDKGFLEYLKVAEDEGSGTADLGVRAFAPLAESVVIGWSTGATSAMGAARGGLGIYQLSTDAFSQHLRATTAANRVTSVLVYQDRIVYSLNGVGLYYEDLSKFEQDAVLITSVADWNNFGSKLWDFVEVGHKALATQTYVKTSYTTEIPVAATTWKNLFTSQTVDSDGASTRLSNMSGRLLALKLDSHANTAQTAAPETTGFGVRSNPFPSKPEFLLSRFVRLSAHDRKDDQAEPINQDPLAVRKRLIQLSYTWVKLYEPGLIWLARVEGVGDSEPYLSRYDPNSPGGEDFYVVQLLLSGTLT